MDTQILQWNVRGLLHNLDDIKELLYKFSPRVLCVQETHLNSSHKNFLRHYAIYRKDRDNALTSSGGVAIIVDKRVACRHLQLKTSLEAVAVRAVLFNKLITIASIYIPPNYTLLKTEFESLMCELPEPYMVVGDFNAHNTLWGDSRCDARGRLVESFLFSTGACLLNRTEPTFFSMANNTSSSIDLSIASSTLVPYLQWNVIKSTYGSDHFPIIITLTKDDQCSPRVPHWKVESADWKRYKELTHMTWEAISELPIDDAVEHLTAFIVDMASICIRETNGSPLKRRTPWWNDECKEARRKQNKAWNVFRDSPTAENLISFKNIKSEGRRTRRRAKRESWQRYVSSINSYTDERKAWNRVNKIKGRETHPLPLVDTQGDTLEDQANSLGAHFEHISSSSHYSDTFLRYQRRVERLPLHRKGNKNEPYNRPFNMAELQAALKCCNKSAPGKDRRSTR